MEEWEGSGTCDEHPLGCRVGVLSMQLSNVLLLLLVQHPSHNQLQRRRMTGLARVLMWRDVRKGKKKGGGNARAWARQTPTRADRTWNSLRIKTETGHSTHGSA